MLFKSAHRILTILYRSRTAQLEMRGREDWAPQSATSGGPSQGLGVDMGMPGYGHVRLVGLVGTVWSWRRQTLLLLLDATQTLA